MRGTDEQTRASFSYLSPEGGTSEFGAVQIGLECWYGPTGGSLQLHGSGESTEVYGNGNGDADLEPDGTLTGEIRCNNGDDMPFTATRR